MRVGFGATFNLAHNLGQMLIFRPHNQFEEFANMWLVGGRTTPGTFYALVNSLNTYKVRLGFRWCFYST